MVREKARFIVFVDGASLRAKGARSEQALEKNFLKQYAAVHGAPMRGKMRATLAGDGRVLILRVPRELRAKAMTVMAQWRGDGEDFVSGLECRHVAGSTAQLKRALVRLRLVDGVVAL